MLLGVGGKKSITGYGNQRSIVLQLQVPIRVEKQLIRVNFERD